MKITVGIFAHVDAGKTTLSEQLLYHGKTIRNIGRVDHKNSYLDNHEIEMERGITIFSDIAHFTLGGNQYYLVDTPGHIDFSPEMERAISVLDYAIIVISAVEGIEGHTETVWNLLKEKKVPTILFINKTDRENANLPDVIKEIKNNFAEEIIYFDKNFDLKNWGNKVIESVAEINEETIEFYLENGFEEGYFKKSLIEAIKDRKSYPVFSGSALNNEGIKEFITIINEFVKVEYREHDSLKGRVFKIRYDEKGERLAFIKILSGTLRVKDEIIYNIDGKEIKEKINGLRKYNGKKFEVIETAKAGEIVTILGTAQLEAGMGINVPNIDSYKMIPTLRAKVIYKENLNPKEVLSIFKRLEEEEQTLKVLWNEEAKEININIMGTIELEILKELCKNRFNLAIEFGDPSILYKETIKGEIIGCGHFEPLGHYAEVILKLEGNERGKGIEFINKCHSDDLTTGQQNLIRTHIFEREHRGILTGSPITDLKITLITGRAHNKHTSGGDFREATKRALRQGLEQIENILLEPFYKFKIEVNIEHIGRVLSDIQKMAGKFNEPNNNGSRVIITGEGPVASFMNYPLEFQSFTKGKGNLSLIFKGYDICHNEEEVIEKIGYDKNIDIEYTSTSIFCSKGQSYLVKGEDAKEYMHCLEENS